MRSSLSALLFIGVFLVGCGSSSDPQMTDLSEVDAFVNENADALARQEDMLNDIGDEEDDE